MDVTLLLRYETNSWCYTPELKSEREETKSVSYNIIKEITLQFLLLFCLRVLLGFWWSAQVCCSGVLFLRAAWAPGNSLTTWTASRSGRKEKKTSSRSGRVVGVARWLSQMSRKQPKGSSNLANGLVQPWALNLQSSSVAQGHIALHPQNWIISSFLLLTPVSLV